MNAQEYARFFETLTPAALGRFAEIFAVDARFRDPFNDVQGVTAIQGVFAHMFHQCDAPRFEVTEIVEQGRIAYLRWIFRFDSRGATRRIEGVSRVEFDARGRVVSHLDDWDPAAQLYEHLPLLGVLLRWLRRRLSAGGGRLANSAH